MTGTERLWRELAQTPYLQVWLLGWPAGSTTGWRDHGSASGAFVTVQGTLTEESWVGGVHIREIAPAQGRAFRSRYIHNVTNRSSSVALSVHAYSPALSKMTRYAVDGGLLVALGIDRSGEQWCRGRPGRRCGRRCSSPTPVGELRPAL